MPIIEFEGTPGPAATLKYDVPLPGRFRGKRVIHLDIGLQSGDIRPDAGELTTSITRLGWTNFGDVGWKYKATEARQLWFDKARSAYAVSPPVPSSGEASTGQSGQDRIVFQALSTATQQKPLDGVGRLSRITAEEIIAIGQSQSPTADWASSSSLVLTTEDIVAKYNTYVERLAEGHLVLPIRDWSGVVITTSVDAEQAMSQSVDDVHFYLVETYGISSFLGDYGLGSTVATTTLLPGEETKINVKTWRQDKTNSTSTTSIVDSYDVTSAQRFKDSVQSETTDKRTRNNQQSWHAEAEVGASWGWGSAKVSAGAKGQNQSSRDEFARRVKDTVVEHAADASSKRTNTVTMTGQQEVSTGSEESSERTIRNVNLRRVLNFVFRQLNQEYTTKVHLIESRIAFSTSTLDSYREVPVASLRPLLESLLVDTKIDEVAEAILGMVGTVMSIDGTPVSTLEKLTIQPDGSYRAEGVSPNPATGTWTPPPANGSFVYRWKPGPLGQVDSSFKVPGVVMEETKIVMPTSDLIVEALLSHADSLDDYALRSQDEELLARRLENTRLDLALRTLELISDPEARATAWAKMFGQREVQPSSLPPSG